MRDAMGIIFTGENEIELKELTRYRSIAAVPIGGRYRIIDFILSNMVNSGIRNVGIITMDKYHSLLDHLDSGKEWDLNRKKDGLFILPPYIKPEGRGGYVGNVEALHAVMVYLRRSTQKYVIISGSHTICNLTFYDALQYHIDKGADITIMYKDETQLSADQLKRNTLIQVYEDGRVWDIEVKPGTPKSNKVSMGMYIMEKSLLEYLVEECVARGIYDFVKGILIRKLDTLKIFGYAYDGYVARIDSVNSYYKHNMELLDPIKQYELFFRSSSVYTKVKNEVPVRYLEGARAQNCLVADGCIVEGEVENSVLFRGVRIEKGAKVKDSIIMQGCEVHKDAVVENVILDKQVIITREKRLAGLNSYPIVIGKKEVI